MKARISMKMVVTAAGGPGRARSEPAGRMWPNADQVSHAPPATSGRLSQVRSESPLISAPTPAASWSGQRIESFDAGPAAGNARKTGQASAIAISASGMIEKNAQRHPSVLAINAPYDGPSNPGTIQAPASRASTRARPDSG